MRPFAWLIAMAAAGTLSACGLKGDLYLPPPKPVVAAPQAPEDAPACCASPADVACICPKGNETREPSP